MRLRLAIAALLALAAPLPAFAAPDLPGWMAGTWTGAAGGVDMMELWTPPAGGAMLGLHQDVRDERTVEFEFLRIEAGADGVTYWASPMGRPATPFRMSERSEKHVVFANPDHAYPTRILYWLSDDGLLHARIEGTRQGAPASEEWSWRRR
jgi:Domain of unknown function (DUF6265)